MRKLLWRKEVAFGGFLCSECGWFFPNPKGSDAPDFVALRAEVQLVFDLHNCAKNPRPPMKVG